MVTNGLVFRLTLLSQVVFYALAVTPNFTSVSPEIREPTQAGSALEKNESHESTDEQHSNQSPENLIARMDDNIQDKLDELDNRMNDVNNNMEMLKKKFDLLSANENYVNQKLFNFEAGMNDRLEKLDNGLKERMDNLEDEMKQELANLKKGSVENVAPRETRQDREAQPGWIRRAVSTTMDGAKNFWKYVYELR